MHGQKKRRKRTMNGLIVIDDHKLKWSLLSEPQKTTEHGYIGLRISVRSDGGEYRELIMDTPSRENAPAMDLHKSRKDRISQ